MDLATSQFVRERDGNQCEYCRFPQSFSELRFHTEHIIARQHGGSDDPDNLALACPECNYHKGDQSERRGPQYGPGDADLQPTSRSLARSFRARGRHDCWDEPGGANDSLAAQHEPGKPTSVAKVASPVGFSIRAPDVIHPVSTERP